MGLRLGKKGEGIKLFIAAAAFVIILVVVLVIIYLSKQKGEVVVGGLFGGLRGLG